MPLGVRKIVNYIRVVLCIGFLIFAQASLPLSACAIDGEKIEESEESAEEEKKALIKWVDFNVPCEALQKAISLDILSQEKEIKLTK